ncbi:MAG: LutC/YkgG family protein [Magnetospiraceae bacterium]
MSDAKANILSRLRAAPKAPAREEEDFSVIAEKRWPPEQRYARLRRLMESVNTEFIDSSRADWPQALEAFLTAEGVTSLAHGTPPNLVAGVTQACGNRVERLVYDRPIEDLREGLFEVQAGITTAKGAIADTGSLILWPTAAEPRLLSLVPPVHIVLLEVEKILDTLWQAMTDLGWAAGGGTNPILISGPSKTADIEQTLTFGVHGPKRLIVIALHAA